MPANYYLQIRFKDIIMFILPTLYILIKPSAPYWQPKVFLS